MISNISILMLTASLAGAKNLVASNPFGARNLSTTDSSERVLMDDALFYQYFLMKFTQGFLEAVTEESCAELGVSFGDQYLQCYSPPD